MTDSGDPLIPPIFIDRLIDRTIIFDGSLRKDILKQIRENVRQRRSLGDISASDLLTIAAAKGLRGD